MTHAYDTWCRQLFASLNDGGHWAVPRSGLVFLKEGQRLVLTSCLPGFKRSEQLDDYCSIKEHFEAAGIEVGEAKDVFTIYPY